MVDWVQTHQNLQYKIGKLLIGCLNSPSHMLDHFFPECFFFYYSNWQFLPSCEKACSRREHRVPQHGEQMARLSRNGRLEKKKKKKKEERLTHWDSHWDPAEHSTQSPSGRDGEKVCVECVYLCLVSCVSPCTCQSCVHALVCEMKQTKFGWTRHKHRHPKRTNFCREAS